MFATVLADAAATYVAKLMAHGDPGKAQPASIRRRVKPLDVQVGCTLNVHRGTATSHGRIVRALVGSQLAGNSLVICQCGQISVSAPSMNEPLSAKDLPRDLATPRLQGLQESSEGTRHSVRLSVA
jgi:hypothetical protein